jgi:hypothetical protein
MLDQHYRLNLTLNTAWLTVILKLWTWIQTDRVLTLYKYKYLQMVWHALFDTVDTDGPVYKLRKKESLLPALLL